MRHKPCDLHPRLCVRRKCACGAFPLVGLLPSADSAANAYCASTLFARFVGTMKPSDSPQTYMSKLRLLAFFDRPTLPSSAGVCSACRFSRMEFPHMPKVSDSAVSKDSSRTNATLHVAFPVSRHGRHTEVVISELNTSPVRTPVNASPASLRTQAHDSEPRWCATPFLCGSLIRYSMPVYLGASLITLSASANTFGGIVTPICFAALRFITSSNFVG